MHKNLYFWIISLKRLSLAPESEIYKNQWYLKKDDLPEPQLPAKLV